MRRHFHPNLGNDNLKVIFVQMVFIVKACRFNPATYVSGNCRRCTLAGNPLGLAAPDDLDGENILRNLSLSAT